MHRSTNASSTAMVFFASKLLLPGAPPREWVRRHRAKTRRFRRHQAPLPHHTAGAQSYRFLAASLLLIPGAATTTGRGRSGVCIRDNHPPAEHHKRPRAFRATRNEHFPALEVDEGTRLQKHLNEILTKVESLRVGGAVTSFLFRFKSSRPTNDLIFKLQFVNEN